MITSSQLRAARALLGIDQRALAAMAGVSLPTIQRMEVSGGQVRGFIDTLVKVVDALEAAGVELIGENDPSIGSGRGVRLKAVAAKTVLHKNTGPAAWLSGGNDGVANTDG
ncbi:MAG: helix-turn-helix transcriptional regulator [Sphingomonadaceae bacterium]|nr:helix-turn-helix transcriptional regulator [Sphingomonadaceae bacterium]